MEAPDTMVVLIDGKEVSVPYHYETETGGRKIKVPELEGEFFDSTALGDMLPNFVSARR